MPQKTTQKQIDSLIKAIKDADSDVAREIAEDDLAQVVLGLEHNFIGPTWKTDEDGDWLLPEHTLGWEAAGWASAWLRDDKGHQWNFTDEQLRFVLWWYAIDETGEFIFQTGVLQRLKGWGKDPLLAVICIIEFVGPCRFDHWERDGKRLGWDDVPRPTDEPVATNEPLSLVAVAAVSQEQTTNTSDMFPVLMSDEFRSAYGITPGLELIRANGGRQQIQLVTSSFRALEGKRTTFVVLNETHHWVTGNKGDKLFETIDGNVTKASGRGARYLAITNAYLPGEDSVAERLRRTYERIQEGKAADVGMLYDSVEAHPLTPMHEVALNIVIPIIRGDAVWLQPRGIIRSIQNEAIPVSRSRRMWLNQVTAAEDSLYQETDWDLLEWELYLQPGDEIVLGMDGGRTDDSTALVAIRTKDMLSVPLGIWEKDRESWVVPRDEVSSRVHQAFNTYKVVAFYADVNLWEADIATWHAEFSERLAVKANEGGNAIGWDMRRIGLATKAHERLMRSILDAELKWTRQNNRELAMTMRRHVLNTYRDENTTGVHFRKQSRESNRKVDAYAALMLAHEALNDFRVKGKPIEQTSNRVFFMR